MPTAYIVNGSKTGGDQSRPITYNGDPVQLGGLLFFRGTTQYLFLLGSGSGSDYFELWKSTDGQNWTQVDTAHSPVTSDLVLPWVPATGNLCAAYYNDGSGNEQLTTLNLLTGLWGSPTASGFTQHGGSSPGLIVRGNGDVVYVYQEAPAPQAFHIEVYRSGSWTNFAIPALNGTTVFDICLDKNDNVLVFATDGATVWEVFFDGSTATVNTIMQFSDHWTSIGPCIYLPIADKVILPVKRSDDGSGSEGLSILVGTNASTASPSFSLTNVLSDTSSRGLNWKKPNVVMAGSESDLIFCWLSKEGPFDTNQLVYQVSSSDGGATWPATTPTVFYDPEVDPPAPDQIPGFYQWSQLGVTYYQGSLRVVLQFGLDTYVITAPLTPSVLSYAHTRGCRALGAT